VRDPSGRILLQGSVKRVLALQIPAGDRPSPVQLFLGSLFFSPLAGPSILIEGSTGIPARVPRKTRSTRGEGRDHQRQELGLISLPEEVELTSTRLAKERIQKAETMMIMTTIRSRTSIV
jgi:hypothetical protein